MTWEIIVPWILLAAGIAAGVLLSFKRQQQRSVSSDSLQLLQQQLSTLQEQLRTSFESNTARVTEFLQQQTGQIQKTHETVGSRLDNATRVVANLDQRMGRVEEATKRVFEVGQDIATLQEILRAPKLRGNLGEQFLGDLLAQMLPQDAYLLQYEFKSGERVDAVIRTAHGLVPVDAKFPLENFQRMSAVSTEEERVPWRKQFIGDVKKHVDDIANKYIRPGEGTFDFALMYVPAENVCYEIIARDEAGGESTPVSMYAMKKRVVPVSPNTFYAYLNTILLGLRGMRVERFAKEILKDMERIRTEVARFGDEFSLLGKHLANAAAAHGKGEKRLARIDDRLALFQETQGDEASAELPEKVLVQ